ncbi:MAG TPA: hypothetical protein VFV51_06885 [Vicinamibacterales bacterium]|nr:hypothetical protein [Vicinamibacterales bacterium]
MILRASVAVLLLMPTTAFAQGDPGPFGGLFGRTPERVGRDYRVFDVRTSASALYEDSLLDRSLPVEQRLGSTPLAGLNVSGVYSQQSTRLGLQVQSTANYSQYLQSPQVGGTTVGSSASASYKAGTRLTLDGSLNHLYTPYFQYYRQLFSFLPTAGVIAPSSPYVATVTTSQTYEATGGFTSNYSKHSSFSGHLTWRETQFEKSPTSDIEMRGGRAAWSRQMNRTFKLRLGYGREHIRHAYAIDQPVIYEFIDLGLDGNKSLSLTRRTTASFSTEMSVVKQPITGRHYRLNGRASLHTWMSRSWRAGVSYSRLTEFLPGFTQPLFSDNVGGGLSGLFGTRTEFVASASAGKGVFGTDASVFDNGRFTIASSSVQLNRALTRNFGVFGQYSFFYYRMPPAVAPVAPTNRLSVQTFTVGLSAWFPVFTQEQTARDSR